MKASTSIREMLAGNKIYVPSYQRAYSWETGFDHQSPPKHVNTFLNDLEEYNSSNTKSRYYYGHFLFEEKENKEYAIIDGQQRLTTIIIFLSTIFNRLVELRQLTESELEIYEDIIKRRSTYRFETVDYDTQLFRDYVVDRRKKDKNNIDTVSAQRIVDAYDFFEKILFTKDEAYIGKMLDTISNASCTTHPVKDEAEAIQMFIFQNNRGKKPSNLELIKAQFMFSIHLYGGEEKEELLSQTKNRFEKIYRSISSIEDRIKEDDILTYTLRVYFNSLTEGNATDRIYKELNGETPIAFIKEFSYELSSSFEYLVTFYGKDERENLEIHSLIHLRGIGVAMPFIIKAYKFNLSINEIKNLCKSLESIILRHRLIGTRADIPSRLNKVYQSFTAMDSSVDRVIATIDWMKTMPRGNWWGFWNNDELIHSLQGEIEVSVAKFLLWKYEIHLGTLGKNGYKPIRFDNIEKPELEHIAPRTKNPESGYDEYDEEFLNNHLNCLGNYLLLSKSHNCSVGNRIFSEKRNSYTHLKQQHEIRDITSENEIWTKQHIQKRKEKIIDYLVKSI